MATTSADYKLIIDVITGNLNKSIKELNSASGAVDKVGRSYKNASKAADEHTYKMNQGVSATASAGKNMSKLSQTIGNGPNGLVGAYATLAANAFAVSAAFNALRSAAQVELLMKGMEVQGSRTGRTLSLVSDSIVKITKGSISGADAMKAASQGQAAGLSKKDLEELTTVATNASIALGRNIPDSMDRVIKGVTKLEPELLDELGLMTKLTEANENYARANSKSASNLTRFDRGRAFVEAIKKEGEAKFGGIRDELDTNNFDQLAATFENLTNSALGAIATSRALEEILSLLTDTSYGLVGALTIFASVIGKQITNYLNGIAAAAAAAASALSAQAVAQRNVANAALEASKVRVTKAEAVTGVAAGLTSKMPQGYKDMIEARKAGTITAAQQERGIKSLELSNEKYKASITKSKAAIDTLNKAMEENSTATEKEIKATQKKIAATQKKIDIAKEEIAANQERIRSEKELQIAQAYAAKREFTTEARVQRANATKLSQEKLARASDSLAAASNLSVVKAFTTGAQSVKSYWGELEATRKATLATAAATRTTLPAIAGLIPVLNATKVGMYGLRLAVQGVGTALMAALPWIGIITMLYSVGELLYNNFFVTEGEKAKKQALEDLNAVLESTVRNIKELNRVSALDTQEGSKYTTMTQIKLNALTELADAYIKVTEASQIATENEMKAAAAIAKIDLARAKAKFVEGKDVNVLTRSAQIAPVLKREEIAADTGISFDSAALDVFSQSASGTPISFFGATLNTFNEEQLEIIKTADSLIQLNPELGKSFVEAAKGVDKFEQKAALLLKYLKYVQKEYNPLRDQVEDFTQALKNAELAQTDFLKSLQPTTPFDNILANFQALDTSITELQRLMNSGENLDYKEFTGSFEKMITNLGPDITKALDAGGQSTLQSYNDISSQINKINSDIKDGKALKKDTSVLEKDLALATEQRSKYETYLAKIIPKQVTDYKDLLASAQEQTILAQSQVTLAQARLSVIQRQGTVTGADVRRQMEGQNAVLAAQQAQEKIKIAFLKYDVDKLKITLQEIAAQQELLQILKKQNIEGNEKAQKARLSLIRQEREALIAKGEAGSARAITLGAQESELMKPKDLRQDKDALDRAKKANEQTLRTLQAGLTAAENAITAIGMQMFTATEINIAAALENLRVDKEVYEAKRDILNVTMSRAQQEQKLANMLNMNADRNLETELSVISEIANAKAAEREKEYKFTVGQLALNIKLAKSRGLDTQAAAFSTQLDLATKKKEADIAAIESQRDIEILNKVAIKDTEDLISRKQNILSYEEKISEARRNQMESSRALNDSQIDLSAKLRGVTDNAATDRIKAIRAARDALDLAKSEAEIKKSQIDLEFELLKAKRALLVAELITAKSTLETQKASSLERLKVINELKNKEEQRLKSIQKLEPTDGTNGIVVEAVVTSPLLQELTREGLSIAASLGGFSNQAGLVSELIDRWQSVTTDGLDAAAVKMKDAIDEGAKTASNRLEIALSNGPRVQGGLLSKLGNARTLQELASEQDLSAVELTIDMLSQELDTMRASFEAYGPQGEVVLSLVEGAISISNAFTDAFSNIQQYGISSIEGITSSLQVASSLITSMTSIISNSTNAKVANIDREISAEEKRDGKSAASLAKLANLEKKKDAMAKKAFETNKKLQIANAVVNTAAGVTKALSTGSIIMAALIGAMGAAQIAIIAGTSYDSTAAAKSASMPSTLSVGKRSDTVDLARGPNANAGGEVGFLRGSSGSGSNAGNYNTVGSAYGGELMRGYGNRGFVVGEKGPEIITPETPISVTPTNEMQSQQPLNATFNIQALDSSGVQDLLVAQKGNIIAMLRSAANASGQSFMEEVNVNVYTRPGVAKL